MFVVEAGGYSDDYQRIYEVSTKVNTYKQAMDLAMCLDGCYCWIDVVYSPSGLHKPKLPPFNQQQDILIQ